MEFTSRVAFVVAVALVFASPYVIAQSRNTAPAPKPTAAPAPAAKPAAAPVPAPKTAAPAPAKPAAAAQQQPAKPAAPAPAKPTAAQPASARPVAAPAAKPATPPVAAAKPQTAHAAPAPAALAPAAPTAPNSAAAGPQLEPQGYTYNPEGRRDPFVSLLRRGNETQKPTLGARPLGLSGLEAAEVTLKGTLLSQGSYVGIVQGADNKTYIVKAGDKLLDGEIRSIAPDAMVITQQVTDPLSLEKQREVRKVLRPTENEAK